MVTIKRCTCGYENCDIAGNLRNAHVGNECIHYFGKTHKIENQLGGNCGN